MLTRVLATAVAVLLAAPAAPAWTKAGHMVTGSVTYQVLKAENPAALKKVVAILKAHPQFEKLWKKQIETLVAAAPDADPDEYLVMLSARWADDIRGDPAYDRPTWHYVTTGFKGPNQPDSVVVPPPDPAGNILLAFDLNVAKIKAGPEDLDRAVPLCWVAHLVGDVHMPMHTVSLFTTDYPDGDRGGNKFWVKVTPDGKPINLHFYWDDLLIGTDRYRECRNRATELRLRPEFARDKLTELAETKFETWARVESAGLAKTVVYRNGALVGGKSSDTAEVLPADYAATCQPVAQRRGVLAGYRLAAVLAAAVGE